MDGNQRRVVITGMGVIGPLGCETDAYWQALKAGESGVRPITCLPAEAMPTSVAAEAVDFDGKIGGFGNLATPLKKTIRKNLKMMCRETKMAVAAAQRALDAAGLAEGEFYDPTRRGITYGSDHMSTMPDDYVDAMRTAVKAEAEAAGIDVDRCETFDLLRWAATGLPEMSPLWLLLYLPNMPASHLTIFNDLRGPSNSLTLRETSSLAVLSEAYHTILRGDAEMLVAGATGTWLHPVRSVHACQQTQVAPGADDPATSSRPFDANRQGMVLGEGAGVLILESLETAQERGATILAEISGVATAASLASGGRPQIGRAVRNVLSSLLEQSGVASSAVGHYNAHGLGTTAADAEEATAVAAVFADRADPLPVVAPKANFGNLGSGSGMVELIASVYALREGTLFPQINYDTPDPECPITVNTSADTPAGDTAVTLNFNAQAQAGAAMISKFEE